MPTPPHAISWPDNLSRSTSCAKNTRGFSGTFVTPARLIEICSANIAKRTLGRKLRHTSWPRTTRCCSTIWDTARVMRSLWMAAVAPSSISTCKSPSNKRRKLGLRPGALTRTVAAQLVNDYLALLRTVIPVDKRGLTDESDNGPLSPTQQIADQPGVSAANLARPSGSAATGISRCSSGRGTRPIATRSATLR